MQRKPLTRPNETGIFQAHGDFIAYMEGRNVITEIRGPWNSELSADYWRQAAEVMVWLDETGPWVTSLVILGSAVLSPEGFASLRERLLGSTHTKRTAAAVIIAPDVEGFGLVEDFYATCYEDVCPMQVFETIDAAREWLSQFAPVSD